MMASFTEPPRGCGRAIATRRLPPTDVLAYFDATFVVLETVDERIADARLHLLGNFVGKLAVRCPAKEQRRLDHGVLLTLPKIA